MAERPQDKAYLSYPDEPMVRALLLSEFRKVGYVLYKDGKRVNTIRRGEVSLLHIPKGVLRDMESLEGVRVEPLEDIGYTQKKNVFGINGTRSNVHRSTNTVRVHITADSPRRLFDKIDTIKAEMKRHGYEIEPTQCEWERSLPM